MLFGHNCDLMKCDVDGNTPLHLACMHGYEEVALYLMENHADIGARYLNYWPYMVANSCLWQTEDSFGHLFLFPGIKSYGHH